MNFKPGDKVKAGQILVQLDDRRQQVALQQAKLNLQDAQRTVERLRSSFEQGAVPQSELDNAILLRDLAEVEVRRAKTEVDDRKVIAPFEGIVGLTDIEEGDRITEQTIVTTIDDRDTLLIDFRIPEAAVNLLQEGAELTVQPWRYSGPPVTKKLSSVTHGSTHKPVCFALAQPLITVKMTFCRAAVSEQKLNCLVRSSCPSPKRHYPGDLTPLTSG